MIAENKKTMGEEISKKQQRIVSTLIDNALKSEMQSLHGAAITRHGKILAVGHNSNRTCVNGEYVSSLHAEITSPSQKNSERPPPFTKTRF